MNPPQLIHVLHGDVSGSMDRVREAIARRDAARVRESAHQLRGLLSNISPPAAQAAALLEAMGAGGELGDAESAFRSLAAVIARLAPHLENVSIDELRRRSRQPRDYV